MTDIICAHDDTPRDPDHWSRTHSGRDLLGWLGHQAHNEGTIPLDLAIEIRRSVVAIENEMEELTNLAHTYAGHRKEGPHNCFLMACPRLSDDLKIANETIGHLRQKIERLIATDVVPSEKDADTSSPQQLDLDNTRRNDPPPSPYRRIYR